MIYVLRIDHRDQPSERVAMHDGARVIVRTPELDKLLDVEGDHPAQPHTILRPHSWQDDNTVLFPMATSTQRFSASQIGNLPGVPPVPVSSELRVSLSDVVTGARLLVPYGSGQQLGAAVVVSDGRTVLLADGRLLRADLPAIRLASCALPKGALEFTAAGCAWQRDEAGVPQFLGRIAKSAGTLGGSLDGTPGRLHVGVEGIWHPVELA